MKDILSKIPAILPENDFGRSWSHRLDITWVKVFKYVIFIVLEVFFQF